MLKDSFEWIWRAVIVTCSRCSAGTEDELINVWDKGRTDNTKDKKHEYWIHDTYMALL